MEFSKIEHVEVTGEEWRAAFHDRVVDGIAELKQERAAQVKRRLYYGQVTYVVKDMSDAQIEAVARIEAERSCERAINEQAAAAKVAKRHAGQSL